MTCPFKVGDRIYSKFSTTEPAATVTETTDTSFKYEYDSLWYMHPLTSLSIEGGECYEGGFDSFDLIENFRYS